MKKFFGKLLAGMLFYLPLQSNAEDMSFFCRGWSMYEVDLREQEKKMRMIEITDQLSWKMHRLESSVKFYRGNELQMHLPSTKRFKNSDGATDYSFSIGYDVLFQFMYNPLPEKSYLSEIQAYPQLGVTTVTNYKCE